MLSSPSLRLSILFDSAFIVLDLGETVHVSTHTASLGDNTRLATHSHTSANFGGAFVDDQFLTHLSDCFPGFDHRARTNHTACLDVLEQWTVQKLNFSSDQLLPIKIEVPKAVAAFAPPGLLAGNGFIWEMPVSKATLILDVAVNKIVELLMERISSAVRLSADRHVVVYMVGGLAESEYIKHRVHEVFARETASRLLGTVVELKVPPNPGAAVLRGATLYGMDPGRFSARKTHCAIGASAYRHFDASIDPEDQRVRIGRHDFVRIFSPFLNKGQEVPVGLVAKLKCSRILARRRTIDVVIYTTEATDVIYRNDTRLALLRNIQVSFGLHQEEAEVQIRFGKRTIEIVVVDVSENVPSHRTIATFPMQMLVLHEF